MKAKRSKDEIRQLPEESRVAWFVVLERARENGDFQQEAEAQAQLERLGLRLSFAQSAKQEATR